MTNRSLYYILIQVSAQKTRATGCGSAWLERLVWDQEAAMVEHQPSKLDTWVRFPSRAFIDRKDCRRIRRAKKHVPVAQQDRATAF